MEKQLGSLIGVSLILCIALGPAVAHTPPNTITFDNQFGEFGMAKLVGPKQVTVDTPKGQERTVHVKPGDYDLLGRYGASPKEYKYTKGDPFEVIQSGKRYSVITINHHQAIDGNYHAEPVSGDEFERTSATNIAGPFESKVITKIRISVEMINKQKFVCLWVGGVHSNRAFPPVEKSEKDLIRETRRIAQDNLKNFKVRNSSYRSLSRCENGIKIKVYSMPIKAMFKTQEDMFKGFPQSRFSGSKVWGTISVIKFGEPLFEKDWDGKVTLPANFKGRLDNRNMNFVPHIEALKNSNLSVLIEEGAKVLSLEDSREEN